ADHRTGVAADGRAAGQLREVVGVPEPAAGAVVGVLDQVTVGGLGEDVDRRALVEDDRRVGPDRRPAGGLGQVVGIPEPVVGAVVVEFHEITVGGPALHVHR